MNETLKIIVRALDEKMAQNMVVIDFQNTNPLADYYVICHGNNDRQILALVDNVVDKLKENGIPVRSLEGEKTSSWQLIDTGDVIVHVFNEHDRLFYSLEKLFLDRKLVDLNEIL